MRIYLLMVEEYGQENLLAAFTSGGEAEKAKEAYLSTFPTTAGTRHPFVETCKLYQRFQMLPQYRFACKQDVSGRWVESRDVEFLPEFSFSPALRVADHTDQITVLGGDGHEVEQQFERLKLARGVTT